MLSLIHDLRSRGHGVVLYQQADNIYQEFLDNPKMLPIKLFPEIIDGYRWRAVAWQLKNGVPPMDYGPAPKFCVPEDMHHPAAGHHAKLNEYLKNYIVDQKLFGRK
jgi:hypothetical protein